MKYLFAILLVSSLGFSSSHKVKKGSKLTASKKKEIKSPEKMETPESLTDLFKKSCPVTIEDVDNSALYILESNGHARFEGAKGGFWTIKDGKLFVRSSDGKQVSYKIEAKGKSILIDEAEESVDILADGKPDDTPSHHWMVNVPE